MAPEHGVSHLSNPLATPEQLTASASLIDGVPSDLESSVRYACQRATQSAGILLRLPQQIIAEAIVVFTRFWIGADGGSMLRFDPLEVAAASVYLVCKPGAYPLPPRQILTAFEYIKGRPQSIIKAVDEDGDPDSSYLSEGTYQAARTRMMKIEAQILLVLGYQTHVALPHALCINYMQTLDALTPSTGHDLAKRTFQHLNAALLSPQLLYLTHQPNALATAAIYLSAKEVGTKLPECEWWEVFDVDREELGFLVVALISMAGFAEEEVQKWGRKATPLTIDDVKAELETRRMLESDD